MTKGFKFFALAALAVGVIGLASCGDNIKDPVTGGTTGPTAPVDPKTLTLAINAVPAALANVDYVVTFSYGAAGWSQQAAKTATFTEGDNSIVVPFGADNTVAGTVYKINAAAINWSQDKWSAEANLVFQVIKPLAAGWGDVIISNDDAKTANMMLVATADADGKVDTAQKVTVDMTTAVAETTSNSSGATAYKVKTTDVSIAQDKSWKASLDPKTLKLAINAVPAALNAVDYVVTFSYGAAGWSQQAAKTATLATGANSITIPFGADNTVAETVYKINAAAINWSQDKWSATANLVFQVIKPLAAGWGDVIISNDDAKTANMMLVATADADGKVDTAQVVTIDMTTAAAETTSNSSGATAYKVKTTDVSIATDNTW